MGVKIENIKRTESEYHKLPCDSSTTLKTFAESRMKYYKKYIQNIEEEEEDDSKAILIGNLVHALLSEDKEEFDNKFIMGTCKKIPTPSVLKFVNALYKRTLEATNEDGIVERSFSDLCNDAYQLAEIKKPGFPKFMEEFAGSDGEAYYAEMRLSKPLGKAILSMQDIDNSNKIVRELKINPITASIFEPSTEDVTFLREFQVEYKLFGIFLKSMYDVLEINHREKYIQYDDLKCTWEVERFYEEYYLKRKTYIQAVIYYLALTNGLIDLGFDYSNYVIKYPRFIVCDSINLYAPLIYQLYQSDIHDGIQGFEYKGREYKGVMEITNDLTWAKENNEWRISRKNALLGGIVPLKK